MYIARVNSYGEILSLSIPQGANNPLEGYLESEDVTIVYIEFEISDRPYFINHHYYDFDTEVFVERSPRPNAVAIWRHKQWIWDIDDFLNLVRRERNIRIVQTDWTQLPDTSLTLEQVEEAKVYRQALRDMIDDCHSAQTLEDISWPTKPNFL